MKNAKVLNVKLQLLAFTVASLALTVFGCNESLQTNSYPDNATIEALIPEASRIIRQALANDDPRIRAKAIEVVAETRQIRLMPKVQRLLKDDFVPVRFLAALAVGDLKYSLAKKPVAQLLKDQNENVRIAAAYVMGRLGQSDSFKLLRKAVTSKDQTVRANAVFLLGKSGDRSALKLLDWARMDEDSDDKTKFQAVEAMAMLGDERMYMKIWPMIISAFADDRIMGIRAMGALGTQKAKDVLITKLDDDRLEVRLIAAEQLAMLGDNTGEPEVLEVFTKNLTATLDKEDTERLNVLTALAIGRIGTEPLKKFLPQLLKNKSTPVRIAAAKAVFQCITAN